MATTPANKAKRKHSKAKAPKVKWNPRPKAKTEHSAAAGNVGTHSGKPGETGAKSGGEKEPGKGEIFGFDSHACLKNGAVDWAPRYFMALQAAGGHYGKAQEATPISAQSVWERRQKDPEFAKAEQAARHAGVDVLFNAAITRAVDGVKETRYGKEGEVVSEKIVYSDAVLLRLMEYSCPEFRQKQQVDVNHGGNIVHMTRADRLESLKQARLEMQEARARANGQEPPKELE